MKVALMGATGHVGSRLLAELLRRGHEVTGIARDTSKVTGQPRLTLHDADASQPHQLLPLLKVHDAVASALKFATTDAAALINTVKQAAVSRLLMVGGAGTLEVVPGKLLLDTPDFLPAWLPEAVGGRQFLDALRAEHTLDWTFLSPSALFVPGERTGKFRLGGDALLADAHGKSWISMEDYAIAFVDELETPRHSRQRFTVGY